MAVYAFQELFRLNVRPILFVEKRTPSVKAGYGPELLAY